MRTEKEILNNIIDIANSDDCVRAVIRSNFLPKRDYLHYFEFCFIVNDVSKYENDIFENSLGERILLYRGDKNYPEMFPNTKAHLMVFKDGLTIVIDAIDKDSFLSRYNREQTHDNVWMGDTYKKLLDKDGILPEIERLEETQTLFSDTPSEKEFLGTCNEFFWVLKTFAEYTLRKELPSAMFYLNIAVRDLLNKMLRWHIYLKNDAPVDMGILDSNMEKLLEKELFDLYKKTYPSADYKEIWNAFDAVTLLWHKVGCSIADRCSFSYPEETEKNMLCFIQNLKSESELKSEDNPESENDLVLVVPSEEIKDEILAYKKEHFDYRDKHVHGSGGLAFYDDFDEWISHIISIRTASPERPIQTSTFFTKRVSDGKLIGCIKLHHSLTDDIKNGGHIAYGIRPSERGKGYGTKQLQLCLEYARKHDFEKVIISCDKDNTASAATAISCGGKLISEFEENGVMKQHYAIDLYTNH